MDERAKQLIASGDKLFADRMPLMSFWQDIAENFYPERSDFTVCHSIGEDFADGLMSSYPLVVRRELGDAISTLRRQDQPWFAIGVEREERLDNSGKQWLEWATGVQKRAMYDRKTQFVRAMKGADHDWATFGQAVIERNINYKTTTLLYQLWHIRDTAWRADPDGTFCEVHRKWKPTVRMLNEKFPGKLHPDTVKLLTKEPHTEIDCRHIVIKSEGYDGSRAKPYTSIYVDLQNQHIMFEGGLNSQPYTIPRWQLVHGSQYAVSPAVVAGLPDARLLQAMTLTLLEAGEQVVRPPMLATHEALRSDVQLYAGGITAVDAAYDERLGEALRPVFKDGKGLPFGMDINEQKQNQLATAFYISKFNLPITGEQMTAYEFSQRMQEYIRQILPFFEPIESDYHGAICEGTFEDLLSVNAFGPPQDIPKSIRGSEVRFKFESPLHQATDREKGQRFIEAKGLAMEAAELDPAAVAMLDARKALRDALAGVKTPTAWLRSEDDVEAHAAQLQQQQQIQQQAAMVQQAAETGEQLGKAGQAMNAAA